jgi:hypothetical protein
LPANGCSVSTGCWYPRRLPSAQLAGDEARFDESRPADFDGLSERSQLARPLKVCRAVVEELKATELAIHSIPAGAVGGRARDLARHQASLDFMTERAVEAADEAGYAVDRNRMSFLFSETIKDWGSDDRKLPDDDDGDGPDTDAGGLGNGRDQQKKKIRSDTPTVEAQSSSPSYPIVFRLRCAPSSIRWCQALPRRPCSTGHSSRACHSSDSTRSCKPATLPKIPIVLRLTS